MAEKDSIIDNAEEEREDEEGHDENSKFDIKKVLEDFMGDIKTKLTGYTISQYLFAVFVILALLFFVGLIRLSTHDADSVSGICLSQGCLIESSMISDSIDKSVDPCTDFYQYACGKFDRLTIPNAYHYDALKILERKNRRFLEQSLRSLDLSKNNTAYHKMGAIYSLCMDRTKTGGAAREFSIIVRKLSGWNLFNDFDEIYFNRKKFYTETKYKHRILALFKFAYNTDNKYIRLERPDILTGTIQTYGTSEDKRQQYKEVMIRILTLMQKKAWVNPRDVETCGVKCNATFIAEDILNTERKIVELWSESGNEYEKPELLHFGTLNRLCPSIPWEDWVAQIFGPSVATYDTSVEVPYQKYIKKLSSFMDNITDDSLVNYILWSMTQRYLPAMGPELHTLHNRLKRVSNGNIYSDLRDECYSLVEWSMPLALRSLMYKHNIREETFNSFKSFYKTINSALHNSFHWMNINDSKKAAEHSDYITIDYGLSRVVKSAKYIDQYYRDLKLQKNFFKTVLALDEFNANEIRTHITWMLRYGVKVNEIYFENSVESTLIQEPSSSLNTIVVPFGAIQEPLFDENLPPFLNMAGIGSLVTAEKIRILFDTYFLKMQDRGWMTDRSAVDRMVQCLITNFQNTEINVTSVFTSYFKGERKISDNLYTVKVNPKQSIVDLASKYWSFVLAEQFLNSVPEQELITIPGEETRNAKRAFYLTLAQTRCEYTSPSYTAIDFLLHKKFPAKDLVNKVFHNSDTFKEAFNCPATPKSHIADICTPQ